MARVDRGMNDYEKRINDGALQAHQNQDLNQIPYKLPGIKKIGEEKVDKYVDQAYNRGNALINQSEDFSRNKDESQMQPT